MPRTTNQPEARYTVPTIATGIPEEEDPPTDLTLCAACSPKDAVDSPVSGKNSLEATDNANTMDTDDDDSAGSGSSDADTGSSPDMDTSDTDSDPYTSSNTNSAAGRASKATVATITQTDLFDLIGRIMDATDQDQLDLQCKLVGLMDDADPKDRAFMHPIIQGEAARARVAIRTAEEKAKATETVIDLADTTDAESSKGEWTLVTQPTPKEAKPTTKTLRLDITIDIAAATDGDGAEKTVLEQMAKLLKGIIKTDPKAALLPWSEVDKDLEAITSANFPMTFTNLELHVDRLRPKKEGGMQWGSILIRHKDKADNLLHRLRKATPSDHRVFRSTMQCEESRKCWWMLYSIRGMDPTILGQAISAVVKLEIGLRFCKITGSNKVKEVKNGIRALHVYCDLRQHLVARARLFKLYGLSATKFPLGTKLCIIPHPSPSRTTASATWRLRP